MIGKDDIEALAAERGRLSRQRRRLPADSPQREQLLARDRELGSTITERQLELRREQPVPIPERVAAAAARRS